MISDEVKRFESDDVPVAKAGRVSAAERAALDSLEEAKVKFFRRGGAIKTVGTGVGAVVGGKSYLLLNRRDAVALAARNAGLGELKK